MRAAPYVLPPIIDAASSPACSGRRYSYDNDMTNETNILARIHTCSIGRDPSDWVHCPACNGDGYRDGAICTKCDGDADVLLSRVDDVDLYDYVGEPGLVAELARRECVAWVRDGAGDIVPGTAQDVADGLEIVSMIATTS